LHFVRKEWTDLLNHARPGSRVRVIEKVEALPMKTAHALVYPTSFFSSDGHSQLHSSGAVLREVECVPCDSFPSQESGVVLCRAVRN
jgi:hypothetical protein